MKVWGCRGSLAAPGPETVRYGGNTSCVEVWLDHGEPEENVPRSCEEDGFPVLVLEESPEGYVRVVVARPQ